MRFPKSKVAGLVEVLLMVGVVASVESQSTIGQYVLEADYIFQIYDLKKGESFSCIPVGRGTHFKFVTQDDKRSVIHFTALQPYPTQRTTVIYRECGIDEIVLESERESRRKVVAIEPPNLNATYMVENFSTIWYREAGLRLSFGTLTVPFRYLFLSEEFVPGGTVGGYVGGQYAVYPDISFVVAAAAGYGYIAFNGLEHSSLTLAALVSVKIGSTFHVGAVLGTDLAGDGYRFTGDPWISFSLGADLFET